MSRPSDPRVIATNRRARHDYEILERVEAGLVLRGSEVKALREGRAQIGDAYAVLEEGRASLRNLEISKYSFDTSEPGDAKRPRELLLHRHELRKLAGRMREKGLTVVPLSLYFRGPWAKVELALVRGRAKADKRQALRQRAAEREMERARGRRRR